MIPLWGRSGRFDEHGIFPMNVVRHGDLVYGYTTGWSRRVSVSVETAIGLAVSRDDGLSFERVGDGPVLSATLHEPFLVGDGHVRHVGDRFHMWYIFGTRWRRFSVAGSPERTYKIGHAVLDRRGGLGAAKKAGKSSTIGLARTRARPSRR